MADYAASHYQQFTQRTAQCMRFTQARQDHGSAARRKTLRIVRYR